MSVQSRNDYAAADAVKAMAWPAVIGGGITAALPSNVRPEFTKPFLQRFWKPALIYGGIGLGVDYAHRTGTHMSTGEAMGIGGLIGGAAGAINMSPNRAARSLAHSLPGKGELFRGSPATLRMRGFGAGLLLGALAGGLTYAFKDKAAPRVPSSGTPELSGTKQTDRFPTGTDTPIPGPDELEQRRLSARPLLPGPQELEAREPSGPVSPPPRPQALAGQELATPPPDLALGR